MKYKLFGAGLLSVLAPILVASEASFKSIVDDWFNTCLVIVDQSDPEADKDHFRVQLYIQGDTPKEATLWISSSEAVLKTLESVRDYEGSNRATRPVAKPKEDAEQDEGGPAPAPAQDEGGSAPEPTFDTNLEASLGPFNSTYNYTYRVTMKKGAATRVLSDEVKVAAFISFPENETELCRVEEDTVFNKIVGGSDWGRFFFLAGLIVLITAGVAFIRKQE